MSLTSPEKYWWKPIDKGERAWMGLAILWCMVLFVSMPIMHFFGKQNSTGQAARVAPADFAAAVMSWTEKHAIPGQNVNGIPVVQVPDDGDAYLLGRMWQWTPILKMKKGKTYRLHISSADLQHGFSLQPMNMNFQIVPGYDHVLDITPTTTGEHSIVCNEFCGIGHHMMTGKIIVEE
jgi:cytochrome c oxidase subunit 2